MPRFKAAEDSQLALSTYLIDWGGFAMSSVPVVSRSEKVAKRGRASSPAPKGGSEGKTDGEAVANGTGEEPQQSVWELLDDLTQVSRSTLVMMLGAVFPILLLLASCLTHREVKAGNNELAALYGGFIVLMLAFIAVIAWVFKPTV